MAAPQLELTVRVTKAKCLSDQLCIVDGVTLAASHRNYVTLGAPCVLVFRAPLDARGLYRTLCCSPDEAGPVVAAAAMSSESAKGSDGDASFPENAAAENSAELVSPAADAGGDDDTEGPPFARLAPPATPAVNGRGESSTPLFDPTAMKKQQRRKAAQERATARPQTSGQVLTVRAPLDHGMARNRFGAQLVAVLALVGPVRTESDLGLAGGVAVAASEEGVGSTAAVAPALETKGLSMDAGIDNAVIFSAGTDRRGVRDVVVDSAGVSVAASGVADKAARHDVFAAWLVATYGVKTLSRGSGVLDVAGGKGQLCAALGRLGVPAVLLEPRPRHGPRAALAAAEPRTAGSIPPCYTAQVVDSGARSGAGGSDDGGGGGSGGGGGGSRQLPAFAVVVGALVGDGRAVCGAVKGSPLSPVGSGAGSEGFGMGDPLAPADAALVDSCSLVKRLSTL